MSEAMTPEEEAAWAKKYYRCPNLAHSECSGPTGTHQPFPCSNCGAATYWNTCWQSRVSLGGTVYSRARVPSTTPVLCAECSGQGALW